ncbi:hypothetical protein MTO96_011934 [Rhipicephalus appendiculatus]
MLFSNNREKGVTDHWQTGEESVGSASDPEAAHGARGSQPPFGRALADGHNRRRGAENRQPPPSHRSRHQAASLQQRADGNRLALFPTGLGQRNASRQKPLSEKASWYRPAPKCWRPQSCRTKKRSADAVRTRVTTLRGSFNDKEVHKY